MKLIKKIIIATSFLLINSNPTLANDKFIDPNVASFVNDSNSKFLVAELNTGKIIASHNADQKVPYKNLINKVTIFALSEKLKARELTLQHRITVNEDETLKNLKISKDINIKDILFLLEQSESPTLAISVLKALNIELSQAQALLDKLTLSDTELNKLEISNENKISAKNLAYLNQESLKNFYGISQLTNQNVYTLENGSTITNDIPNENNMNLGLSHNEKNSELLVASGNTNFLIVLLDSSKDSTTVFSDLTKLYTYLFSNYAYQAVIQAGNHKINNQDIIVNSEIYDLFYKNHNANNLTFQLMNEKIILVQNYNTLSANNASVFSTYKPTNEKRNSIRDALVNNFEKNTSIRGFSDKEKLDSVISNTSYIISLLLLAYLSLYSIVYIFKKFFRRKS